MKIRVLFFLCFISFLLHSQTAIEGDYTLIDNITINSKSYTIYSKSNANKFQFKVFESGTAHETTEYTNDINANTFFNFFTSFLKTKFDSALVVTSLSEKEKNSITQLSAKIQVVERKKSDAKRTELENLLVKVEEDKPRFSAKIIMNKIIPYKMRHSNGNSPPSGGNITLFSDVSDDERNDDQPVLEIIEAKITFFNNKASSVYIKAQLKKGAATEKLIFINNQYSVALRYFNRYGSVVSTRTKDGSWITIDYNHVFDYEMDEHFNYSIANSEVTLSHVEGSEFKNEAQVIQRRFFDYFTAVVYSDLMGFNTENANPLLNAQARLLVPLNLKNYRKWSIGRQFNAGTNIALSNSFDNENRFIAVTDDDTVSNFELLKRNNLYGELGLEALTHEAKGWFSHFSLGYKVKFYRTSFRYTQTIENAADMITNRQIISIGHGPFFNIEIRPQNNFGADVTIGLEDLNFSDSNTIANRNFKNDIIVETDKDHFLFAYNMINLNASFYWLTNPESSKGGIYANLGGYFHTDSNSVFPQFMVGYATNLTSFVNRFKVKGSSTKPESN